MPFSNRRRPRFESVRVYRLAELRAVTVSFLRPMVQGSVSDRDMHAGQQYVPFSRLPLMRPGAARWRSSCQVAVIRGGIGERDGLCVGSSGTYTLWSDPEDALGERTHASPRATQVDAILDCVTTDGRRAALLIEVKLSEHDFNGCSARLAPSNDRPDVCDATGPFGNNTTAFLQLRNHGREHRRGRTGL